MLVCVRKTDKQTERSMDTILQDILDEITCPGCKKEYKSPRHLPCNHTLCKTCVENFKSTKCPQCSYVLTDVNNYPVCKKTELLIKTADKMRQKAFKKCQECGVKKNIEFCQHCKLRICSECKIKHEKEVEKVFKDNINCVKDKLKNLENEEMKYTQEFNELMEKLKVVFFNEDFMIGIRKKCDFLKEVLITYEGKKFESVLEAAQITAELNLASESVENDLSMDENGFNVADCVAELLESASKKADVDKDVYGECVDEEVLSDDDNEAVPDVMIKYDGIRHLEVSSPPPKCLCVTNAGDYYIIKEHHDIVNRIEKYDTNGAKIGQVKLKTAVGELVPYQCAYNTTHDVLIVVDSTHNIIAVFDRDLSCLKTYSLQDKPRGLSSDENYIYLGCEKGLKRFDYNLRLTGTIPFNTSVVRRVEIAKDKLFIATNDHFKINLYAYSSTTCEQLSCMYESHEAAFVEAIKTDKSKKVLLFLLRKSPQWETEIKIYGVDSMLEIRSILTNPFRLREPRDLYFMPHNRLAITDSARKSILYFQLKINNI